MACCLQIKNMSVIIAQVKNCKVYDADVMLLLLPKKSFINSFPIQFFRYKYVVKIGPLMYFLHRALPTKLRKRRLLYIDTSL